MTTKRNPVVPVLLAAAVLVGGANVAAYAANGDPLLLGKRNTETKPATVKNTGPGPALRLQSRPVAPPIAVNSDVRVPRLNADLVDGLDSSELATVAHRYAVPTSGPLSLVSITFPGLPAGQYVASYSVITTGGAQPVQCYFRQADVSTAQALSWAVDIGTYAANNATAFIDTTGGPVTLYCTGPTFSLYTLANDAESTVLFSPVNDAVQGTVATARPTHERQKGASGTR